MFNKIQDDGHLNHDVTWCPAARDRLESAGHLLYVKSFILQHNTEGLSLYLSKSDKKPRACMKKNCNKSNKKLINLK